MVIVSLRKKRSQDFANQMQKEKGVNISKLGVLKQYDLYYAMGLALIMVTFTNFTDKFTFLYF